MLGNPVGKDPLPQKHGVFIIISNPLCQLPEIVLVDKICLQKVNSPFRGIHRIKIGSLVKLLSMIRNERTHQITEANQMKMSGCLKH